jgi:predicted glycoside hydrolase/deacetylase ChbG (UPF0249 family)
MNERSAAPRRVEQCEFLVHLDDSGATESISTSHLELIRAGFVDSISLLSNCPSTEFFVHELAKLQAFEKISIYVHLNVVEGSPISSFEDVSHILDQRNQFNLNHLKLFKLMYLSSRARRAEVLDCIHREFVNQVEHVIAIAGMEKIVGLDSHRHIHAYGKIHTLLVSIAEEYQVKIIRKTHEKLFIGRPLDVFQPSWYIGVVRNLYLKFLSFHNDSSTFLHQEVTGIIYSGSMSRQSAIVGIRKNFNSETHGAYLKSVLAIFHAGKAKDEEVRYLPKSFQDWYLSEKRTLEYKAIGEINDLEKLKSD